MKKQLVILGIVVILVSIGLSGCMSFDSYSDDTANVEKFIGTWTGNYFPPITGLSISVDSGSFTTITFIQNGTYMTTKHIPHAWLLQIQKRIFAPDVNIIMLTSTINTSIPFSYTFSENNTKLHLDGNGGEMWLIKQ